MDNDPLLPYQSPWRISPHLEPLPEDNEITLPVPLTPSVLKDLLIFGPSSPDIPSSSSSNFLDALTLSLAASPKEGSQQQDPEVFLPHQWSKSNLHRSKTAPAMAVLNDFVIRHPPVPKPPVASQSIVRQACILLALYLSLGIVVFFFNRDSFVGVETHPVVDALYFCIVTMCTIGYGDITPNSTLTKLFSIMFVLIGFGFIDILLTGMIGYVLDLQENYLLRHVREKTEREKDGNSCFIDVRKGRMRIRMKVALALGVVILCIGVGGCVMHFVEKLGWLDSFYLSVMSVTTVGYGDRAFKSLPGRVFASIWLLVSTLAVARAFLYLAEARVDKRQRMMAKWVLSHDMTVSEFLAADIDNNGFVSKSEYVIYKLKEMGKVSEKSIMEICKQFERLDTGNLGRITLADLRESHQP